MGQALQRGLLQSREPVGMAGLWGGRLVSTVSWLRLGGLRKMTEGGLIRRSWMDGSEERMWMLSLRIQESAEARIISSGEGKVMGSREGMGGGGVEMMESCFWIRGTGYRTR